MLPSIFDTCIPRAEILSGELSLDLFAAKLRLVVERSAPQVYPANDSVKAPKGLMHYVLPAQDSSDVKGKNNQQDVVLKALKECGKIRPEDAAPYAPAYILQKVWASGLERWTTKLLREAFAKDLNLNILLDAEVSKLRDTIRAGLTAGQWDMKVGDRLFIKTADGISAPDIIEFSERMELYRRGILQPPEPREIELSAQVMPSAGVDKTVRVRWRAKGALTVTLYQEGGLISGEFRPSDEYEGTIQKNTLFRIVADYGKGETAETQTQATLTYGGGTIPTPNGAEQGTVFQVKPEQFELNGTPNSVFNDLSDRVSDYKVQGISSLELSVAQVVDYRKLGTTLPLLARFPMQIDQTVTIQSGDQFVRLEYQGPIRGFQSFLTPTNALLNTQDVQANVVMKLIFEFNSPVQPGGTETTAIAQALNRNPVERLNLTVKVTY